MSIVLVYAVLIMGLFSTVGYLADSRLNSAFPSIDDLEENRVALENDSFNELRNSIPPSAQMVIFDQNGNRLYASDDDVAKSIDANDLEIINGTEEDQVFYEVLQRFDARYGTVYEINLCGMSGIGSSKIVLSSCVCKLDGTIVEGDLFAGRESLSKRELSLINGEFSANKSIQKLEYVTVDNQPRTLVFISSNVSEATYDDQPKRDDLAFFYPCRGCLHGNCRRGARENDTQGGKAARRCHYRMQGRRRKPRRHASRSS